MSKVDIETDHPDTEVSILVGNYFKEIDSSDYKSYKVNNFEGDLVFKLEREGAQTITHTVKPKKFNPLKVLDLAFNLALIKYYIANEAIPNEFKLGSFPLLIISTYSLINLDLLFVHGKSIVLPALEEYPTRVENTQLLALGPVNIDLNEGDLTTEYYDNWRLFRNNKPTDAFFSEDEIQIEEPLFALELKRRLAQTGFVDTTEKVFARRFAEYEISASLSSLNTKVVSNVLQVVGVVKWVLTNQITGEELAKYEVSGESIFSVHRHDVNYVDDAIRTSLANLFERTMVDFIQKPKVLKLLEDPSSSFVNVQANWDTLHIPQGLNTEFASVGDALASVVTVIDKKSHGSGVVIGSNGYIITNHHVIQQALKEDRKLMVRFSEGEEGEAEIIRFNPIYDLALIKIQADSLQTLNPQPLDEIKLGLDVFAIGTPERVELGQTISKGIISGKRVDQDRITIQTDVSVNGGNSGGALVYNDGSLIGIVNAKLVGFGVEGIGFAIPADYIESALKIQFHD